MPARTWPAASLALLLFAIPSHSQDRRTAPVARPAEFRRAVRQAGMIFEGVVTSIVPERDARKRPVAVRISFRVNHAIRGVGRANTVTLREWAGLWTFGPRYHVGERVVLMLYQPSRAGLTSPVGGDAGRIKVDAAGRMKVPASWRDSPEVTGARLAGNAGSRLGIREFANAVRRAEEAE